MKLSQKTILSVGLDVSKAKIDVCIYSSTDSIHFTLKNNRTSLFDKIQIFSQFSFLKLVPFVIESTGDYHLLACILLYDAGFLVKEINPIIVNQYIKTSIRGTKTDKTDSEILAKIGAIHGDTFPTFTRSTQHIELTKKLSLIETLEKQIQSISASLKGHITTMETLGMNTSDVVHELYHVLDTLKQKVKLLQLEIELSNLSDTSKEHISRIQSITGISSYMAHVFYLVFGYKSFHSKQAMYAFVGFDPRLKNSGQRLGKARVSKRGNSYVRKKLFQAAFCGIKHCELFRNIYQKMKALGKHHYIAVIAVVKKIVHIIWSILKYKTVFNPDYGKSCC